MSYTGHSEVRRYEVDDAFYRSIVRGFAKPGAKADRWILHRLNPPPGFEPCVALDRSEVAAYLAQHHWRPAHFPPRVMRQCPCSTLDRWKSRR